MTELTVAPSGVLTGDELAQLVVWAQREVLGVYPRRLGAHVRWCASWVEHPEAVARLGALRAAHHALYETGATEWLAVWQRDHLDPALDRLTSPSGPFALCDAGTGQHHLLDPLPTQEQP